MLCTGQVKFTALKFCALYTEFLKGRQQMLTLKYFSYMMLFLLRSLAKMMLSKASACRGNPEGVAAALPTSPARAKPASHPKQDVKPELKPEPQFGGADSDTVMQHANQEPKSPPPAKPQVHLFDF